MKLLILLLIFLIEGFISYCQTLNLANLSSEFNYTITVYRNERKDSSERLLSLSIMIKDKKNHILQSIKPNVDDWTLFKGSFKDAGNTRSYITHYNKEKAVLDNDYGDFVVADFNFDGKGDFAIKRDFGGASGPLYSFYIMKDDGRFYLDDYLTNTVALFPGKINSKTKTISVWQIVGYVGVDEMIYQYVTKAKIWKLKEVIKHR